MKKIFYLLAILALFTSCDHPNNQATSTATESEMKDNASKSIDSILNNDTLSIVTTGMERYTSWYTASLTEGENNIKSVQCATMFILPNCSKAVVIISRTYDGTYNGVTYNNEVVQEVFDEYTLTSLNPQPEIKADSASTLDGSTTLDYTSQGYVLYSQHTTNGGGKYSTKLNPSATGEWELDTTTQTMPVLLKKDAQKIIYYNIIGDSSTSDDGSTVYIFSRFTADGELVVFGAEQNFGWGSMIFEKE